MKRAVVAMVSSAGAAQLRHATDPLSISLGFLLERRGRAALLQTLSDADVVMVVPGDNAELLREVLEVSVQLELSIVMLVELGNSNYNSVAAAMRCYPSDVIFRPLDSPERMVRSLYHCEDRRLPISLARKLLPAFRTLSPDFSAYCLATACGAVPWTSVNLWAANSPGSYSTSRRELAGVGIPSVRDLIRGSLVVRALDGLTHRKPLTSVASRYGFGSVRAMKSALEELGGVSVLDLRQGVPLDVVVQSVASSIWRASSIASGETMSRPPLRPRNSL